MGQLHNEIKYATSLIEAYRRALGEVGAWGIERFGETLQPVLDLWSRAEWSALQDEMLWWFAITSPAVAGEFGGVEVRVPAGSGLLVVEGWIGSTVLNAGSRTATVVDSTGGLDARDRRYGSSQSIPQSLATLHTYSDAISTQTDSLQSPANVLFSVPVVVTPGNHVNWQHPTANTAFVVSAWGRVRLGLPGEIRNR